MTGAPGAVLMGDVDGAPDVNGRRTAPRVEQRRLEVRGAFDLGQSIRFGFGQREAA